VARTSPTSPRDTGRLVVGRATSAGRLNGGENPYEAKWHRLISPPDLNPAIDLRLSQQGPFNKKDHINVGGAAHQLEIFVSEQKGVRLRIAYFDHDCGQSASKELDIIVRATRTLGTQNRLFCVKYAVNSEWNTAVRVEVFRRRAQTMHAPEKLGNHRR
jgi:hypothetical protein